MRLPSGTARLFVLAAPPIDDSVLPILYIYIYIYARCYHSAALAVLCWALTLQGLLYELFMVIRQGVSLTAQVCIYIVVLAALPGLLE